MYFILVFFATDSLEFSFRPMVTSVALSYNLLGILNVFYLKKICVPEQKGNKI